MSAAALALLPVEPEAPSLLACLTAQIVAGRLDVDEARRIVLRRRYYQLSEVLPRVPARLVELERLEEKMILRAMGRHADNVSQVAMLLGYTRNTLYRKLKRMRYWL